MAMDSLHVSHIVCISCLYQAFTKMDPAMTGHINPNELRRFYTVPGWAVKEFGESGYRQTVEFQTFCFSWECLSLSALLENSRNNGWSRERLVCSVQL